MGALKLQEGSFRSPLGFFRELQQNDRVPGDFETSVFIVGAGPSGMLSALLLARAGVPCVICEQHAGISTHPKAMGITRRTAEIFRQCGLLEEMCAQDFSSPETQLMIWSRTLVGEEYGRAQRPGDNSYLSPCRPFHSPQTHTEMVLLNALLSEPLVTVRFENRVQRLKNLPQGVELDLETPEGPVKAHAEWVVAADGAGSQTRKSLGIEADGPGDLGHFLKILGVAPWVMSPKIAASFRAGRIFFAGDAAARLSPAGGLGMNTGLQSAHNLAWKIAAVVQGRARESLLDTYEKERRALTVAVMRHTNENSGEIFRQVNCALQGDEDGLNSLIRESHRNEEDLRFDTGTSYGDIRRFPHASIGGKGGSTLDFFGRGFVIVAGPQAFVGANDLPEVKILETFPPELECGPSGAVLVRPDGFVAWKKVHAVTNQEIRDALDAAMR